MAYEKKRREEQQIMAKMVQLYCRGQKHGAARGTLCPECAALLAYAHTRTQHCPHMANKTFCSKCPTQCYQPEMRQQVRAVMRYAGPRMLWHGPLLVLKHALAPKQRKAPAKASTESEQQELNKRNSQEAMQRSEA